MSLSIEAQFKQAEKDVSGFLPENDRLQMLKLYSLYKQATRGDATGNRPPMTRPVKRIQWDAWRELSGMPQTAAMEEYVSLVDSLRP